MHQSQTHFFLFFSFLFFFSNLGSPSEKRIKVIRIDNQKEYDISIEDKVDYKLEEIKKAILNILPELKNEVFQVWLAKINDKGEIVKEGEKGIKENDSFQLINDFLIIEKGKKKNNIFNFFISLFF